MKDFESLLNSAIENKDKYNAAKGLIIKSNDRELIKKLEQMDLIRNPVYSRGNDGEIVSFDITYDGLHYFDEQRR